MMLACGSVSVWQAVAALGTLTGVAVAVVVWRSGRKSRQYEALARFMERYAQPEMLLAVETLWTFQRTHPDNLGPAFAADHEVRKGNDPESHVYKRSADYCRRPVSHFYRQMAVMYFGNSLPGGRLFEVWTPDVLEIIPKVLIPMENALGKEIPENKVSPVSQPDDLLLRFYRAARKHHGLADDSATSS